MKIFGISFSMKREPGPGARVAVIEESLESHKTVINALIDRMVIVEKKAEATRRKVYRDNGNPPDGEPVPAVEQEPEQLQMDNLKAGDPVPPGSIL